MTCVGDGGSAYRSPPQSAAATKICVAPCGYEDGETLPGLRGSKVAATECYHSAFVTTWEPRTYLRYADVRFRAGLDLIARIPTNDYRTIYDLGCGTGYLTYVLAEKFPQAQVIGIDNSPEMLAEAEKQIPQPCAAKTQRKGPFGSAQGRREIPA